MQFHEPKDCRNYLWTFHSKRKLFQYGFGPGLIKRVIRYPDRKEEGVAENTVAVMKDKSTKSTKKEVWVMYQNVKRKKRIISVWIYLGKTKPETEIFVPDEVWEELTKNNGKLKIKN